MRAMLVPEHGDGSKIQGWHRDRLAVVYVRQSSRQQVADHGESTRLQYGLADRAAALGCNSFRLSVEWARVFPLDTGPDQVALTRYAGIVRGCVERGLEPLVTLHHFTHPAWLGEDLWLRPDAAARFRVWAELAVEAVGRAPPGLLTS